MITPFTEYCKAVEQCAVHAHKVLHIEYECVLHSQRSETLEQHHLAGNNIEGLGSSAPTIMLV